MVSTPVINQTLYRHLLLKAFALFLAYLSVAMSLPVVSIYVTLSFAFSNSIGGLAVGIAFLSTILTRGYAGRISDVTGGKLAMRRGFILYAVASLICLMSALPFLSNEIRYGVLIIGRLLLGLGESLTGVGMVSWGIAAIGSQYAGKVLSLMGMGMYGAFIVGGPIGMGIYELGGFQLLMIICVLAPIVSLFLTAQLPEVIPVHHAVSKSVSFFSVIRQILQPGMIVALQGIGFAAIGAFFSLYFLSQHWHFDAWGVGLFGVGFVIMRLLCSNFPDRFGGTRVAIGSFVLEVSGLMLIALASEPYMALIGALLTGMGCSMIFPSMGVEVVKIVPPQLRGVALGGFSAFQDLSYGLTGPLAGIVADYYDFSTVYFIGAIAALLGLLMAIQMKLKYAR